MELPDLKAITTDLTSAHSPTTAIDNTASNNSNNKLGVTNDKDALALFLRRAARRSDETLRRYTRELVRFTIFLRRERVKTYQQCTVADIEIYIDFLHTPWPQWQQPGIDKANPDKVFFPNAIRPGKSTDQIVTVLSSFFSYLQATGYLIGNPVYGFDKSGDKIAPGHGESRFFYEDEWSTVVQAITTYATNKEREKLEKARLQYVIGITYGLGLRQSEVTGHTCRDIRKDGSGQLILTIRGKGRRLRQLPINDTVLKTIMAYRTLHDQEAFAPDDFPLAPCLRPVGKDGLFKTMSSRMVRKWFSQFMEHCALQVDDMDLARRLRNKSFHSLRHTTLSHLARYMDIEDLALFAGHEAITTTQQYYTPERERLRELTKGHGLSLQQ